MFLFLLEKETHLCQTVSRLKWFLNFFFFFLKTYHSFFGMPHIMGERGPNKHHLVEPKKGKIESFHPGSSVIT